MLEKKVGYRILAIDPAAGTSGWCLIEITGYDPITATIVAHGTVSGDKLVREDKPLFKAFGRQFSIVDRLELAYASIIAEHQPDIVVSESAFGYTHMSALISLTLVIHSIRRASRALLGRDIVTVPPTISKKSATGSGGADKDAMRLAFDKADFVTRGPIEDFSEHEIDAFWHGMAHVHRDIIGDIVQVSAKDKKKKNKG